jgi:hypothetical protein
MNHEAFYATAATTMPVLYIFTQLTGGPLRRAFDPDEALWKSLLSGFVLLPVFYAVFAEALALWELSHSEDLGWIRSVVSLALWMLLLNAFVRLLGAPELFSMWQRRKKAAQDRPPG